MVPILFVRLLLFMMSVRISETLTEIIVQKVQKHFLRHPRHIHNSKWSEAGEDRSSSIIPFMLMWGK